MPSTVVTVDINRHPRVLLENKFYLSNEKRNIVKKEEGCA